MRRAYDVVVIGAGVHGLSIAYELARRGVRDVAVLDRSYVGSGASGRNTAIIRSNYRTAEGVAFYDESVHFNVLFSQRGHLTFAHTETAIAGLRVRAEVNQLEGVDSRVIFPDEIARIAPAVDVSDRPRFPILAALYHPPGGIIRHDAVVWGYARRAHQLGVDLHPMTEVTGIELDGGAVARVRTSARDIATRTVVNATAGWASTIAAMVDLRLPIVTHPLQALVTEPIKPMLDPVLVSATLHVYVSQTDRGELVIGSEIDPYASYSSRSTLPFLETSASHVLELLPCVAGVRVLRQWAGICDMTPDYSPIMGPVPAIDGFWLDVGWGTYGFKAGPVSGRRIAEAIATGRVPEVIRPFTIERFARGDLIGEKAAAAVSH
jgi:sarcosine oxidase subunit beta